MGVGLPLVQTLSSSREELAGLFETSRLFPHKEELGTGTLQRKI